MKINKLFIKNWVAISKEFIVPHTEEENEKMLVFLEELMDVVGSDENHPLVSLLETVAIIIEDFETRYYMEKK